ncbi:YciI family protein [Cellulomonas sp. NPDC055163]
MIMMDYGGVESATEPMDRWTAEELQAHFAFQAALHAELVERGELVDGQGLASPDQAKFVVSDGVGAPVVVDGPYPEGKELLAGYWLVDVESLDRAIEIAAAASAAPAQGGRPLQQRIEVREVMSAPSAE